MIRKAHEHSAQVSKQEQDAYCYLRLEIKVGVETDTCPKKNALTFSGRTTRDIRNNAV